MTISLEIVIFFVKKYKIILKNIDLLSTIMYNSSVVNRDEVRGCWNTDSRCHERKGDSGNSHRAVYRN